MASVAPNIAAAVMSFYSGQQCRMSPSHEQAPQEQMGQMRMQRGQRKRQQTRHVPSLWRGLPGVQPRLQTCLPRMDRRNCWRTGRAKTRRMGLQYGAQPMVLEWFCSLGRQRGPMSWRKTGRVQPSGHSETDQRRLETKRTHQQSKSQKGHSFQH